MLAAAIPDAREHARGPGRRPAASELLPATQLLPIARVEVLLPWKPRPQRPPARSSLERSSHSCPPRLCSSAAIDAIGRCTLTHNDARNPRSRFKFIPAAQFFKNIRGVSESQSGKQYPGNDFPILFNKPTLACSDLLCLYTGVWKSLNILK